MSSLSGGACIHAAIKVTCMAWHASIAVGEGVKRAAQHPIGIILTGTPVREQSQFVSLLSVLQGGVWMRMLEGERGVGIRKWVQRNI